MHVTARKPVEAVPGQWAVDHEVVLFVARCIAEGADIATTATKLNGEYRYGVLPGVPNPRVADDGTVLDGERMRSYSISEVAAIAALPEAVSLVKALQEERAREAKEEARDARVEQLAEARRAKAALHDQRAVPSLYAEVVELRRLVRFLLVCADKQIGVPQLQGRPVWKLPEASDENGELKY